MVTMQIISILLVALYVGAAIWKERELPESISAMVYLLPKQKQWIWIVWIWAATFTMTPALFEAMPDKWQMLAHGFATSMLFTGAMPLIRHEKNKGHYAFAISAGIFSQFCVLVLCHAWMLLWSVLSVLVLLAKDGSLPKWLHGKGVIIIEFVCYITLMGAIFTYLLKTY